MPADIHRPEVFQKGYERLLREAGGGSDDGGMPPDLVTRVTSLEHKVDSLIADGRETRVDMKSLIKAVGDVTGKVSQLPSTWTMAGWFVGVAITLAGLVFTIARAMK